MVSSVIMLRENDLLCLGDLTPSEIVHGIGMRRRCSSIRIQQRARYRGNRYSNMIKCYFVVLFMRYVFPTCRLSWHDRDSDFPPLQRLPTATTTPGAAIF